MKRLLFILMVGNLFSQDELNLKDKTWSAQIGFGTRRNINIFEISRDFKINDKSSFYLTVGGPLSSIGAGYSFSNNYNENGLCFSASIGQLLLHYDSEQSDVEKDDLPSLLTMNASYLYQWRISNQGFLSVGLMAGIFTLYFGKNQVDKTKDIRYILPVLTYDYRF